MHALTGRAARAGALLLLAICIAPVRVRESPERGVGSHGLGARVAASQGARLPIPTPQEIDALRQLLRILASLAGSGSSQVADESATFLVPQQQPARARHSMAPAAQAHSAPTRR